jgi:hypothetical protein
MPKYITIDCADGLTSDMLREAFKIFTHHFRESPRMMYLSHGAVREYERFKRQYVDNAGDADPYYATFTPNETFFGAKVMAASILPGFTLWLTDNWELAAWELDMLRANPHLAETPATPVQPTPTRTRRLDLS